MPLRILLLTDCFVPDTRSGARQMHDLAVAFTTLGHRPSVVTPASHDALATSKPIMENGIEVLRVDAGRIKHESRVMRAIHEAMLSPRLWRQARQFFLSNRFDLVVFYSPTIFFGHLVKRLRSLYDCPAYLILRDIFPQWAVDAGLMHKGPIYWFFRAFELAQYRAASVIGVQTPANKLYFQSSPRLTPFHVELLYNWVQILPLPSPSEHHRTRLGLLDKVILFYGGNLGVAQDTDGILELADRLRDRPNVHVLIAGSGSEEPRLRLILKKQKPSNATLIPSVPHETYMELLNESDVGLVYLNRKLGTHNFPGKMLSYMMLAKPMLASVNPGNDVVDLIREHQIGFATSSGCDETFLHDAQRLCDEPTLRRQLGLNGRKWLESDFAAEKAAQTILEQSGLYF